MYQNTRSHDMKSTISNASRMRGFVFRVDVDSGDVPSSVFAMPCISRAGVTSTLSTSSELNVSRKAKPLAAGLSVFDISHNNSSTSTAESPILVANTSEASLCDDVCLSPVKMYPVGFALLKWSF